MQQEAFVNHYQTLQVHPAAPLDLITGAYWHLVGSTPSDNGGNQSALVVHDLSRAYAVLADPIARATYDRSIELKPQPLVPKLRKRHRPISRFLPWRRRNGSNFNADYYEVIRVHQTAAPKIVDEGYAVMRTVYLRLVRLGDQPVHLLDLLEEAYSVTSDADLRRKYDAARNGKSISPVTNGAVAAGPSAEAEAPPTAPVPAELATSIEETTKNLGAEKSAAQTAAKQTATHRLRSAARVVGSASGAAARGTRTVALAAGRTVLPDEEAVLVARISDSADAVHGSDLGEQPRGGVLARVIVIDGPEKGAAFEVTRWPIDVGAARESDIALPALAPHQLRLLARGDELVLYALSESPAVRVNGEPVTWSSLDDGDAIMIGPHSLRIERISR
jgi:curved DNA-binding protein CbpA